MSRRDKINLFAKMSFENRRRLEQMYRAGEKMEVITATFNKNRADIQKYLSSVGVPKRQAGNRRQIVKQMQINYRQKTTMPIRDMHRYGEVVFLVDVYGWTGRDVCIIPGGSEPMLKAVQRLGLDPDRYQAMIWDAQI